MLRLQSYWIYPADTSQEDMFDLNRESVNDKSQLFPRRYTLTHNDVTGELVLYIGSSFNQSQLKKWCTQLMRDEVVAEWKTSTANSFNISLHIHCHVSGGHPFLAPARLRYHIFQYEMPLVLQSIRHGESTLFSAYPELDERNVWVHYHSEDPEYSRADCWGPLSAAANGFTAYHKVPLQLLFN